MASSLPPPGWYPDPSGTGLLRWWDGATWTGYTTVRQEPARTGFVSALPWRIWAVFLSAIAIIDFVCFGVAESTKTADPGVWTLVGVIATVVFALVGATVTLGYRNWRTVAVFAALLAGIIGLAIFMTSVQSTSRSCNNDGQPISSGTFDCDTSDVIGGPVLLVVLFVPSFAVSSLGKAAGRITRRGSGADAE